MLRGGWLMDFSRAKSEDSALFGSAVSKVLVQIACRPYPGSANEQKASGFASALASKLFRSRERSEERRVGKECRSRRPSNQRKNNNRSLSSSMAWIILLSKVINTQETARGL